MKKETQNNICKRTIEVGRKNGEPIYKTVTVVSTNTKVIVYDSNGDEIGQAGCLRKQDFDFESLYKMALKKSGSTIIVAA